MKSKKQLKLYLVLLAVILLILDNGNAIGQKKPGNATPATTDKSKRLLVKSYLGKATGTISMKADEGRQIITQPIKVIDDNNVAYAVSSYQFAYKRIGVTEDETTGKTAPQSDIAADRFTTTPLPAVWQQNILEGLHQGEELYFFDIIVLDKKGRRFFAPEIKISIQ